MVTWPSKIQEARDLYVEKQLEKRNNNHDPYPGLRAANTIPCRNFPKGLCNKGADCPYSHANNGRSFSKGGGKDKGGKGKKGSKGREPSKGRGRGKGKGKTKDAAPGVGTGSHKLKAKPGGNSENPLPCFAYSRGACRGPCAFCHRKLTDEEKAKREKLDAEREGRNSRSQSAAPAESTGDTKKKRRPCSRSPAPRNQQATIAGNPY